MRVFTHPNCGGELLVLQIGRDVFRYEDTGQTLAFCATCHKPFPVGANVAATLRVQRVRATDPFARKFRDEVKYRTFLAGRSN